MGLILSFWGEGQVFKEKNVTFAQKVVFKIFLFTRAFKTFSDGTLGKPKGGLSLKGHFPIPPFFWGFFGKLLLFPKFPTNPYHAHITFCLKIFLCFFQISLRGICAGKGDFFWRL